MVLLRKHCLDCDAIVVVISMDIQFIILMYCPLPVSDDAEMDESELQAALNADVPP